MTYKEIIERNRFLCTINWWPIYAYHMTDVNNAVNILTTGKLFSRIRANEKGLMKNDNASRQVINMTHAETLSYVRFYFRPLTPTQYYNEGFKHPLLRYDNDSNANIPVPVFFFMDLDTLLKDPKTRFSETAQSGYGSALLNTPEQFEKMNFGKIYGSYWPQADDKKYRHAEILFPGVYEIDKSLRGIVCRNEVEKNTLLNCLYDKDRKKYYEYKNKIRVIKNNPPYQNNGLFITDCNYHAYTIGLQFSNTYSKRSYINVMKEKNKVFGSLTPIQGVVELSCFHSSQLIKQFQSQIEIDYEKPVSIRFADLPISNQIDDLSVKVYFENSLMCYVKFEISEKKII